MANTKPSKAPSSAAEKSAANVGFEAKLWAAADKLRSNMDAAEYKHVVLGLIFLKYISDAFEERHSALLADRVRGADRDRTNAALALRERRSPAAPFSWARARPVRQMTLDN